MGLRKGIALTVKGTKGHRALLKPLAPRDAASRQPCSGRARGRKYCGARPLRLMQLLLLHERLLLRLRRLRRRGGLPCSGAWLLQARRRGRQASG
jgi:hypothetical protein